MSDMSQWPLNQKFQVCVFVGIDAVHRLFLFSRPSRPDGLEGIISDTQPSLSFDTEWCLSIAEFCASAIKARPSCFYNARLVNVSLQDNCRYLPGRQSASECVSGPAEQSNRDWADSVIARPVQS